MDTTGAIVAMDCPAGTYTTDKGSTSAAACVRVTVVKPANQRTYVNTAITGLSNIATKGVLPLTWSATGLPVGLVLSHATGKIAGTPTKTCSCSVTLTATDADGHAGRTTFTWSILPFGISTTSLPKATPGMPYGPVTLHTGGAGKSAPGYATTLRWSPFALPKGLTLSSAGVLAGTLSSNLLPGTTAVPFRSQRR